jgi:dolichol-phosphate mannosyltransferase
VVPVTDAVVVIPTYCESESLAEIVRRILAAQPGIHILVVDDNSPDGTGEIADRLAADSALVHVLHRPGKQGLGAAYRAGFGWALEHGYDYVFEFDADGSHQPEELGGFVERLDAGAGLVIGTRWMPGGVVRNWPLHRRALSKWGTAFARFMLRSNLRDITSGFRGFRAQTLIAADYASLVSQGYCFQIELAWRVEQAGVAIVEQPITFVERAEGRSKMSIAIVLEAMVQVFGWGVRGRLAGRMRSSAKGRAPRE